MTEFIKFNSMSRLSKEVVVTEKIDGTNAQIFIGEDGEFLTGSRTRWITPEDDNYGFARWAQENKDDLMKLGPGRHFGEWWGQGIQRRYGLQEKRFSLFNAIRWASAEDCRGQIHSEDPRISKIQDVVPCSCYVVPVLWRGPFEELDSNAIMEALKSNGSYASPGFNNPEGIIVYHVAAGVGFKKTFEHDKGKWSAK